MRLDEYSATKDLIQDTTQSYIDGIIPGIYRLQRNDGSDRKSLRFVAQEVLGTTKITYGGVEMDLGKPFERITMVDAVKKYTGIDWNEVTTLKEARELAKEHKVEFEERHKKGDILSLFFEAFVEEHLIQPTFVMDHPIEISPLTKKKPENPEYTERFEFFMNGWENGKRILRVKRSDRSESTFQSTGRVACTG